MIAIAYFLFKKIHESWYTFYIKLQKKKSSPLKI